MISQSNSMRTAASCCFTPAAPCSSCSSFTQAATSNGRMAAERQAALFAPGEEPAAGAGISAARVGIVDVGGEEFDVAPAGDVVFVSDEDRHYLGVGRPRGRNRARMKHGGQLTGHPRGLTMLPGGTPANPCVRWLLAGEPLSIGAGRAAPVTG